MQDSYDEIRYPSLPRPQSHPAHVAAIATLAGMSVPAVGRWHVLELGCGDAANLLPLAMEFPGGRFVGLDRAHAPLERGRALAAGAGLGNLELHTADLLDWQPRGEFDYIVAHGVYSWVPDPVRERMLEVCARSLAPGGIAYISYNVLPGAYLRRFARDLMLFHGRACSAPEERIAAAREIAQIAHGREQDGKFWSAVREEMGTALERSPHGLFHDDLAGENQPFYLTDFTARAGRHELQYLGDAQPVRDEVRALPFPVADRIEARQYGDFFAARRFRESLLCRAGVPLSHAPEFGRMRDLFAAARGVPGEPQPDGTQRFDFPHTRSVTTNFRPARDLLCRLSAIWPRSARLGDVLPAGAGDDVVSMAYRLFEGEAMELRTEPPRLAAGISRRPATSPLARAQVAAGMCAVTNQRHQTIELEDTTARRLVSLLDGTRSREEVGSSLAATGIEPGSATRDLDAALDSLYRLSLLVE